MFLLGRFVYFHLKSDPVSGDACDLGRLVAISDSDLRSTRFRLSNPDQPKNDISDIREKTANQLVEATVPKLNISTCFGSATPESIANREHRIFMGISMNNSFFNAENIHAYIVWALKNTKDTVLIVLADGPHAINLQAFQEYDADTAHRKAIEVGNKKATELEAILATLPAQEAARINVRRWVDLSRDSDYQFNYQTLEQSFLYNPAFYYRVYFVVQDLIKHIQSLDPKTLTKAQLDRACLYVLHELAAFLRGFSDGKQRYDLAIYPTTSNIWQLISDLQTEEGRSDLLGEVRQNGYTSLAVLN